MQARRWSKVFIFCLVFAGALIFSFQNTQIFCKGNVAVFAATNENVLMVSAKTNESPAKITLQWSANAKAGKLTVYRRAKGEAAWGAAVATLNSGVVSYEDNNVVVGQAYEYCIASSVSCG